MSNSSMNIYSSLLVKEKSLNILSFQKMVISTWQKLFSMDIIY